MFHWFTVPPAFSYLKLHRFFVPAACFRIWQSGCVTSQAGQGCVTAGCACTSRTERGLLAELPPESAVLARPEAVLVTANVLQLRLAGYGSVEGVSAHIGGRGNSDMAS